MPPWLKKHFPRVDKLVDQYGYWAPFLGTVWGGMTWIANSVPGITQYGWGAVVFAGLGVTCLAALAVTASLAMYRFFRPLRPKASLDQSKSEIGDGAAQMMLNLHKEVHDTLQGFERDLQGTNERLESKSSDHTTTMVNLFKDSDASIANLAKHTDSDIAAVNARIDSAVNSLRLENKMLADKVFALKAFYEMRRRRRAIDRLTLLLDRPLRQPPELRDWSPWGKRFKKYEVAIHGFASLVGIYYPEQANALIRVDPKVYRQSDGQFAPENFPDPGTAHDFKTFRQWSSAYEALADDLINMVDAKT